MYVPTWRYQQRRVIVQSNLPILACTLKPASYFSIVYAVCKKYGDAFSKLSSIYAVDENTGIEIYSLGLFSTVLLRNWFSILCGVILKSR